MKVLFLCNLIPLKTGAFESLLIHLGREFRRHGDEFVVAFSGAPIDPVAEGLRAAGVRWHLLQGWADGPGKERAWAVVVPALKLLRQEKPDCVAVHFGNEIPTLVLIMLGKVLGMGGVKWVWQQHQQISAPGCVGRHVSRLRLLGLLADHFVAVYEGGRVSLSNRGIADNRIAVIHNAIESGVPVRPRGWLRQELSIPEGGLVFATVGSLIPRKRIDFILRACAALPAALRQPVKSCQVAELPPTASGNSCSVDKLLREEEPSPQPSPLQGEGAESITTQQPNSTTTLRDSGTTQQPNSSTTGVPWRLLIIGDGPERCRLTALAEELGIAERVRFLGLRNDVRDILPECDLYLHSASAETCTYTVTEAMSAGVPVVMLDAGAAREQVEDGVSGFVLETADVEEFAGRIRCLACDDRLRRGMGEKATIRWSSKFDMGLSVRRYHGLFRSLVDVGQ